ncbi:toprim domain-containing protein [Sinobaca sp. H24]|uniref:toprim domain-containing protein n=1 Tax=Sinobaca sp. H24 TaxID=2923376 RepID=UPI0027E30785|nr:toprim domain-containing protein [Sinobaca sp. H24]
MAVFESPIDMLSYWSVHKNNVQDTKLLSMGGLKIGSVNQAIKDAHSRDIKLILLYRL